MEHRPNANQTPRAIGPSERARFVRRVASRLAGDIAATLRAEGKDVLRLEGTPYWLPPEHVLSAGSRAVTELGTAPSQGSLDLRCAIAAKLARDNGFSADPHSEILVTNAAMHALTIIFTTVLNPGDEVVIFSPAFFYYGILELIGAVPVYVQTQQENNWQWDIAAVERAITPRTKIILVNSPTNPTGYVATEDDLRAIADIARRRNLLVVSDEAYDSMLYDGARHTSFASLSDVRDHAITVYSLTKSYAMRQWRVGFVVAPATLTPYLRKVLEWNVLSCNHVAQRAAQAALEGPQEWVKEIAERFQRCRDAMVDGLRGVSGISFTVPKAAPFLFLNVSALGVSGDEFSRVLMYDYGVPTEPGSFFGSESHIRLEFGGDDEVLQEAARRIKVAAEALRTRGDAQIDHIITRV